MPVNHTCTQACLTKRLAAKYISKCNDCGHSCNLKCHHISSDEVIKELSSNSNVIFVCTKCHLRRMKSKRMSNMSTPTLSTSLSIGRTATSIDNNSKHNDNTPEISPDKRVNTNSSDHDNLLREIIDRLSKIEENNHKMHDSIKYCSDQYSKNEKYNDELNIRLENISIEVLKQTKILEKTATTEHLKTSTANICASIDKKLTPMNESNSRRSQNLFKSIITNKTDVDNLELSFTNNLLNLNESADGRPSISVTQTVDDSVVELLQRSDNVTWETLDIVRKEMNDNFTLLTDNLIGTKKIWNRYLNKSTKYYTPELK